MRKVVNNIVDVDKVEGSELEPIDLETQLSQDIEKCFRKETTGNLVQPFFCLMWKLKTSVGELKNIVKDTQYATIFSIWVLHKLSKNSNFLPDSFLCHDDTQDQTNRSRQLLLIKTDLEKSKR